MAQPKLGIIFIVNYYLYTDDNLGNDIFKSIKDLEKGLFNISSYQVNIDAEFYFLYSLHDKTKDTAAPQTVVKKLQVDDTGKAYTIKDVLNLSAINLGDKDVLSTALNFLNLKIDAKEYVLVLYNHGNPFGLYEGNANEQSIANYVYYRKEINKLFKSYEEVYNKNILLTQQLPKLESSIKIDGEDLSKSDENFDQSESYSPKPADFFEEQLIDYKPDMLTNAELNKALTRVFYKEVNEKEGTSKKRIKLLINCGCYVQNLDMLYALHDVADYIIGAPTSMPEIAFNFNEIVNPLIHAINNDNIDYETIIRKVLADYNKLQFPTATAIVGKNLQEQRERVIISAIDCKYVKELVVTFDELLLEFIANPIIYFEDIKKVKKKITYLEMVRLKYDSAHTYKSGDILFQYDLGNFIDIFIKETNNEMKKKLQSLLDNILDKMVLATYKGDYLKNYFGNPKFSGISFYFPDSLEEAKKKSFFFNTFYSSASVLESTLAKDSYIENFIFLYYKYLEKNNAS
jgi:Clostripain family